MGFVWLIKAIGYFHIPQIAAPNYNRSSVRLQSRERRWPAAASILEANSVTDVPEGNLLSISEGDCASNPNGAAFHANRFA
jgi:hypothetical protein